MIFAPWRVISLIGLTYLLCLGSVLTPTPDWDFGVSILMAGLSTVMFCSVGLLWRKWK